MADKMMANQSEANDAAFMEIDGDLASGLLIVCDHARNFIPDEYNNLGLPAEAFERHIAYDIGVEGVVRRMCEELNCPAVMSNFSRLLIDPNRGADDPTLVMRLSDGQVVPGNHPISPEQKAERIARFHKPYHDAIAQRIRAFESAGVTPAIFSIHSFTPHWKGTARPWEVAMLCDVDTGFHGHMLDELRNDAELTVGDNEPYDGALAGDCMYTHGLQRGLQHALVELRQDLIADAAGQKIWTEKLVGPVQEFIQDPANRAKRFVASRTGPYMRIDS
ncbi:MAG: N-formylglutamate amidohydrolase [Pseudomonadota bacterium]